MASSKMESSNSFRVEEESLDLWDPSVAFLWPHSYSSDDAPAEDPSPAADRTLMTWANDDHFHTVSNWSSLESENDVLFGDYSDAGVDQVYSEEVIVDSCTNSNRFDDEDEDEEDQDEMQRQLGEQMHIFETKTTTANLFQKTPVIEQVDDKILSRAEEANAELNPLKIKLEAEDCLDALTDSVVSTPDVLDDVITLESDGQFRRRYCGEILQEIETVKEEEMELVDEYVMEYIDASQLDGLFSLSNDVVATEPSTSNVTSEFENDTGDEEYVPPPKRGLRSHRKESEQRRVKRGRPAKPLRSRLTPQELANLDPETKRHKQLRFKNNEASRLSRFKRRQMDLKLDDQCVMFERENKSLRKMLKSHKNLHKKLRALFVGIKIKM